MKNFTFILSIVHAGVFGYTLITSNFASADYTQLACAIAWLALSEVIGIKERIDRYVP